jgi:hypothetical protein
VSSSVAPGVAADWRIEREIHSRRSDVAGTSLLRCYAVSVGKQVTAI